MKLQVPLFIRFDPLAAIAEALRDNPHRCRVLLRDGRPIVHLDILPDGTLPIEASPTCPHCHEPIP